MELTTDQRQQFKTFANEVIDTLQSIAKAASKKLRDGSSIQPANSLVTINTMTDETPINKLHQISKNLRESYQKLTIEPAIARVKVTDEKGQIDNYYICRTTPVTDITHLASYYSPVGRLASLPIGAELSLRNGRIVEVVEKFQLHPSLHADEWDSFKTIIESQDFGPLTIESLRALLIEVIGEEVSDDILEQLLSEAAIHGNIIEGIRRRVITKMELRDQPILDQYQDEIFRLPLDKRLMIMGPPGTGKTTTLIRRLGQKTDTVNLDNDEKRLLEEMSDSSDVEHARSWLMFTPTELLRLYLKEAFARESIPASDLHIKTWHDYRRELAKNIFNILKTASGSGVFILKDNLPNLREEAIKDSIKWFNDFDTWQKNVFLNDLNDAATLLYETDAPEVQNLGVPLREILSQSGQGDIAKTFKSLALKFSEIQALVSRLKEETDSKIKAALNIQLNRNRAFLDELALFIDGLQQTQTTDLDDQDDTDVDEEADIVTPRTDREAAVKAFTQAVRAQARAAASNRTLSKTSRYNKIIEWLTDHGLTEANYNDVGTSLVMQSSARRLMNPVKRYFEGIPKRYRAFRRERQQDDHWYQKAGFEARDIHPLELDIVLLAILHLAGDLISRPEIRQEIASQAWSTLKQLMDHYRIQILVDEATDFSPIQLACMAKLAHPQIKSFFACGDFNQRLTNWGSRSVEDLKWVFPDFDIREITVSYRQSKQLNELARAIIRVMDGSELQANLPTHVDNSGVVPALLEYATDLDAVSWLANRISDIERFLGYLPSTAIFVNSEEEVDQLAHELNSALAEQNIPVIACREGQAVGQESNVRVFDIQHIKGLEFEAVFFVGIDKLAANFPDLFAKYLYVGTTRAATYLGVTCNGALPSPIAPLRSLFRPDWQASEVASGD